MKRPIWADYIVWDTSDELVPVAVGFKPDTPEEIIAQYHKDIDEYNRMKEENPDARYV